MSSTTAAEQCPERAGVAGVNAVRGTAAAAARRRRGHHHVDARHRLCESVLPESRCRHRKTNEPQPRARCPVSSRTYSTQASISAATRLKHEVPRNCQRTKPLDKNLTASSSTTRRGPLSINQPFQMSHPYMSRSAHLDADWR